MSFQQILQASQIQFSFVTSYVFWFEAFPLKYIGVGWFMELLVYLTLFLRKYGVRFQDSGAGLCKLR